ncbi:hypothetical protein [Gilliamella sp. wkB112]|uniref:hypothetical protein n=1 Tax=Gilliamella sp. wkB112 TaxID=3120257 RepID=UPI00080EC6B9|nr:hypothetical protein [Gilliamella apicola]OCG02927.1 hypothetical protein A9G12_08340 [Gilliamella apicola]
MIKNICKLIKSFFVNNKTCFLIVGLLICCIGISYQFGVNHGKTITTQKYATQQAKQTVDTLNQLITSTKQLTETAINVSEALSQQIAERKLYDEQSTQALQEALNKTADNRSHCVFDDSVLLFIDSARTSAAKATTYGITGTTNSSMRTTNKTPK